jgi:hypothetical protein
MRAHPPRVVQWLIPEEPRLCRIIHSLALQECDVSSSRISIFISVDYRAGAYARKEQQHHCRVFFVAAVAAVITGAQGDRDGHSEVERRLDRASRGGGQVPGAEAEVRTKARVGLCVSVGVIQRYFFDWLAGSAMRGGG